MVEQRAMIAPPRSRSLVSDFGHRLWQSLPKGGYLPDEIWHQRHMGTLIFLWLHVVALVPIGTLTGHGFAHSLREVSLVALAATLAGSPRFGKRGRACLATFGLVVSSALLVHFAHGTIEMHFHFFVVLGIITLYQDWIPFLLAILFVLIDHGIMGAINPAAVYNHPDAWAHPWRWALIHATFVLAASAVNVIAWNLNEFRALHDPLTALPNRASFFAAVDRGLARAVRYGQETALLMLDLDGFKQVNDRFGHQVGDALLIAVAARLRCAVRREDAIARLGGDEYAILLYGMHDEETARTVAQRLVTVMAQPFQVGEVTTTISMSVGVAISGAGSRSADLMRRADAALYEAKRQGKKRVAFFAEYMEQALMPANAMQADASA